MGAIGAGQIMLLRKANEMIYWCNLKNCFLLVLTLCGLLGISACEKAASNGTTANEHAGHNSAPAKAAELDAASAAAVSINQAKPSGDAPEGMVWIPGGTFWMGCENCNMPDALPSHLVTVDGFWMDQTPITNAQFEKFVKATGYITIAERKPDPKDFPGAPPENLVPGSAVFSPPAQVPPTRRRLGPWLAHEFRPIRRRDQDIHVPANQLFSRVPEKRLQPGVGQNDFTLTVSDDHGGRPRFHHLPEHVFGVSALGDIGDGAERPDPLLSLYGA